MLLDFGSGEKTELAAVERELDSKNPLEGKFVGCQRFCELGSR